MSNKLKVTPGPWIQKTLDGRKYNLVETLDDDCKTICVCNDTKEGISLEEMHANAHLIAASKDLYNSLKKIHSECHNLLNRGTNEKLSVIDCITIIGAIGETCEASMQKANPYYKP